MGPEARARATVGLTYPDLPIVERRDDILAALRDPSHQVLVVAGETGSGKSTQLPKLCLEAGRGAGGLIGHTQPRRIAARAVAERIAEELGTEIGDTVGYTVRFTDRIGPATAVKVMTDGILLAELQRDRRLSAYDTIVVDEAHERSLNVDFLLGYLKQLLPQRPDLQVVITSATIDTARFADHFGGAPVIEVGGRAHPVEIRYRPVGVEADDDRDQVQAICDAVLELVGEGPGDVLVFLSGEREIRDTADGLARLGLAGTEVVPLYARLSAEEQHRVFRSHRGRRIVCATNVAETSLTVPGIRYVVDPGTARISRFNRRTKVQRLPIEAISQASAAQRAGRCGRIGPGICIRLYAEDDLAARPAYTDPEILRTNLASVILRMAAIGLGDVRRFPFLDPPDDRAVADGVALLRELRALEPGPRKDGPGRITRLGRRLARLPIDPRLGRMVLEADRNGCAAEVIVIAAALSIQDPRQRPAGAEQAAAELHARFADPRSDFVSILRLWAHLQDRKRHLGSSAFRRLCRDEHLHHLRVREWQDLHGQLRQVARNVGVRLDGERHDPAEVDHDTLHRSLLAGVLTQVGTWDPRRREYDGTRQSRFTIAPGSSLGRHRPRWVMAAELVETERLRARTVAGIRPDWIEALAAHLVKRSHGDPWWEPERGAAVVEERVTLHGLTLVSGRPVQLARVDPATARALFLQRALVEDDWDGADRHEVLRRNRELVAEVEALGRRLRSDVLAGDVARFAFFDDRVPTSVVSGGHFDRWWADARQADPDLLAYPRSLLLELDDGVDVEAFPDRWETPLGPLPLSYLHEPGAVLDGVTVDVPLTGLVHLDPAPFEWQVPGHRVELVTALLRTLRKPLRRRLGPAADVARDALAVIGPEDGPLLPTLARHLARATGEAVAAGDLDLSAVPEHLRVTFRAVDDRGRPVAWSKDLPALRRSLDARVRAAVGAAASEHERSGLTAWELGDLPREVQAGGVTGYPALVDEGESVGVRVRPTAEEQHRSMWGGTRRLLLLGLRRPPSALARSLPGAERLALATATGGAAAVIDDCAVAVADELLRVLGGPVWARDAFAELAAGFRARFDDLALPALRSAARILTAVTATRNRLDDLVAPALQPAVADIGSHLSRLVAPGFVTDAGVARLADLERYAAAAGRRLDKLAADPARDRALMARVHALEDHPGAGFVRWQLEELRVSFFAQSLGTKGSVSEQRIRRQLERRERGDRR